MIIDKEQLISLLKEKTGHEREEVEDQLEELVKRIQQAAEEDKTFEIDGFGTFSMEDDNLCFEPSDMLETEINNKYAGMKPIELIGAFKEPDGGDIPAIDIDENIDDTPGRAWSFDKESAGEDEPSEQPVTAAGEELAGDEVEDKQSEKSEEQLVPEELTEEIFDSSEDEENKDQSAPSDVVAEEAESEDESTAEEIVAADEKEGNDIMSQLLIAAVVVIAVGLSGWIAYDTGMIGPEGDSRGNTSQASQLSVPQNNVLPEEETSRQESSKETEEPGENNSSEPEEELTVGKQEDFSGKKVEENSVFGLKGEVNETISDGYTIVVHSLRKIEEAEKRKDNLQESGYRVVINKANVQGTTYYRVGLGQFENVDDALEAVSDIPKTYQSSQNHFVKRIQ